MRSAALILIPFLASCWSSNTKHLEREVHTLTVELEHSRAEVKVLRRQLEAASADRGRGGARASQEREARIAQLEQQIVQLEAARPPAPPPRPIRRQPDPQRVYAVEIGASHVEGPADAKVTMVIAHEYSCPYCERVRPTLVELRKKYGRDLRIVYKQLVVHPLTATAPALAICAATRQRKHDRLDPILWEKGFHQRTFDTQIDLPDGTKQDCWEHADGCPVVLGFARAARLDLARFKADMAGVCVTELADTARDLRALGVAATPTFFINGRHLAGAQPLQNFAVVIDEEVAKADQRIKQGTRRARYYQEWVLDRGERMLAP